jgi:hypothetical protein
LAAAGRRRRCARLHRVLWSPPVGSIPAPGGAERKAMAFVWFLFGLLVGLFGLILLPLLIAALGAAIGLGLVVVLPLVLAVLILFGILAATPTIAYGLAIAAVLFLLWASDRKGRQRR